jgi:REP element-mobilizing transposase RayT/type I restriction-modification system DNA methylase subunit
MGIFQKSVIKKHLNNLDKEQVEKAHLKFISNYNPAKIEQIKTLKEEEYQDGFLRAIFVDVFGYTLRPDENFDLQREFKNQTDGKKADGAILKNEKAIAVIELKSTKTKDLTKVTQQAFNYKNNQPECKYVITSNFQKLRFYIDYANEYEEFDLFYLEKEDFELLYLLLNKKSIFDNLPLKLKEETKFHEQEVSSKLYKDYSHFKRKLYENLTKNHPESDKLTLFKKSQKLLDRFLFILFAEDSGLLPPNSISRVIETYYKLIELDAKKPLYEIFKQYFGYMNIGRKGKTSSGDIPAYNGGLFYTDTLLDNLKIDDNILIDDLRNLSEYDFNTEIDVNILGHIFEHSLNEIEEITAEIEGTTTDKTKSKRKKDGVFYTPKYITQYIVENTIGTLCNEKRIALDIEEIEFDGTFRTKAGKLSEKGKKLYNRLKEYKDWLISLKIIDPACGSGAFLNQALTFLIDEHTIIDDIIAELTNTSLRLFDVDKSILENNLFGVDINEESVEIAQLSLWLRTAQKGRKLSNLNNNIKCGNSLIDDPEIAGNKAFHWQTEFSQIFKEKDKKAYHITTAIHDSRTSARMEKYKVRERREMGTNPYPNIIYFTEEDNLLITQTIAQIVKEDNLNVLAYNICADHIHLLLVCDIDEIPCIMQKIKGRTSYIYKGLKPLAEREKENKKPLWQQKYSTPKEITSQEQLNNTKNYIQKNRSKHELPEHSDKIKLIIQNMCTNYITATQKTEYFGGFDCVIGNPPYVRSRGIMDENEKSYFTNNYKTTSYQLDLYKLFIEKSLQLINPKGILSFITPSVFLSNDYDKTLRKHLLNNFNFKQISTSDEDIFRDASVKTVIFTINKNKESNKIKFYKIIKGNFIHTKSISKDIFIEQDYIINENINLNSLSIVNKLYRYSKLNDNFIVKNGIKVRKDLLYPSKQDANYKPFLLGKNINSYLINFDNEFIHYLPENEKLFTNQAFRSKDIFIQKKLIVRQILGNRIITTFDDSNFFTDQTTYVINNKSEKLKLLFLLSLMNSKLLYYYFKNTFSDNKVNFPKVKRSQILEFPIKEISKQAQQPFIEKADKMLALNQELQSKSNKFLNRIKGNFEIEKISKKLSVFYDYDYKTFVLELKKQKIVLSLKQQDEWQDYFDSYKAEINQLQNIIQQTDTKIDTMVYKLYGLNEEEIDIIEKSI